MEGYLLWFTDIAHSIRVEDPSHYHTNEANAYAVLAGGDQGAVVALNKYSKMDLQIRPEALLLEEGDELTLYSNYPDFAHTWSPSKGLDDSTNIEPYLVALENMVYYLNVIDDFGCEARDSIYLRIIEEKEELNAVAQVFSPNGDGNNDQLEINADGACTLDFRIFDTWGREIFKTDDVDNGWDGTYKGSAVPSGTYMYVLNIKYCGDPELYQFQGEILIVK